MEIDNMERMLIKIRIYPSKEGWHEDWLNSNETKKLLNLCRIKKIKLKESCKNNIKMGQFGKHPYPMQYRQHLLNVLNKL
jgi:hypothetical protein